VKETRTINCNDDCYFLRSGANIWSNNNIQCGKKAQPDLRIGQLRVAALTYRQWSDSNWALGMTIEPGNLLVVGCIATVYQADWCSGNVVARDFFGKP
jgi:hypothetical protein